MKLFHERSDVYYYIIAKMASEHGRMERVYSINIGT